MPNYGYQRGVAFERKIVAQLRDAGWIASRTPGSKGSFDVIAMRCGEALLLQMKKRARAEREALVQLQADAAKACAIPLVIQWKRGGFDLFFVSGDAHCVPLIGDECRKIFNEQ